MNWQTALLLTSALLASAFVISTAVAVSRGRLRRWTEKQLAEREKALAEAREQTATTQRVCAEALRKEEVDKQRRFFEKDRAHHEELRKLREEYEEILRNKDRQRRDDAETNYWRGYEEGKAAEKARSADFRVKLIPTYRATKAGWGFGHRQQVEVGYQYQLFVRGVPCFEPHFLICESYTEKQIDVDKIAAKALQLAKTVLGIWAPGLIPIDLDETVRRLEPPK